MRKAGQVKTLRAATRPDLAPPAAPQPSRGRPRSAAARARVLRAARALLDAHGPGGVTIEAVAARSGVGKPTIYRTWPNAQAVLMAALMDERATEPPGRRRRAPPLAELRQQLRDIAATLTARSGRSVTLMLAAAEADTELVKAFRHHFILARRAEGRRLLAAAVARGELRAGTDLEVALDQLYGPIFFRVLVGHAPPDAEFCERLLDQTSRGLAAKR